MFANNVWTLVAFVAIVFVLTYDPQSRTLEKFMGQPVPPSKQQKADDESKNCKHAHLQGIQFGQDYACPKDMKNRMGAIIGA